MSCSRFDLPVFSIKKLPIHPTEKKVLSTIIEHQMIERGDILLVGVSGGPDSVCLLKILHELKHYLNSTLIVAHFDHGLRPKEDKEETDFVSKLAKRLNLPLVVDKAKKITKEQGSSIEEKARNVRYQFFQHVMDKRHAHKVALGHNMNDQAETVIMHILRGTGPTGLSGIPPVRQNRFIRPLIDITRDEIYAYLRKHDESFMIDSSNLENKYLRNRIRLELLPLLLTYQPRLIEHLRDLAFLCRKEDRFMENESDKAFHKIISDSSESFIDLSLVNFKNLSHPLRYRIIRKAIRQIKGDLRKIDRGHIRAISNLVNMDKPQAEVNLPEDIIVKKMYTMLRISSGEIPVTPHFSYVMNDMGKYQIQEINKTISFTEISKNDFMVPSPSSREACLDLEKLTWPLRVRNFRAGDKYIPLGMSGFKKVKDIFIDNKITSEERNKIPILVSCNDIVWVYGIRIDDRYKVKQKTKRILRCKVE